MKSANLVVATIAVATVLCSNLAAQTILTNGLVAYYPFNGNANDARGTNHGTVNGAVLTTNRIGVANAAYNFNGSGARIDFNSPPLTQVANWSVSVWINPATLSQDGIAIHVGHNNPSVGDGYGFGFQSSSTLQGIFGGISYFTSGQTIPSPNQWYHVVMLRDSSLTKFYINGTQTPSTYGTAPYTPTDFTIGSQNGLRYFNGKIDEVRIYNRALSGAEVTQLYNETEFCTPHIARATATVVNGFVVGATVTDPSCGYTSVPNVTITGGGGSGATATATMTNGYISAINITSAGCCYTSAPIITIESPSFVPSLKIEVSRVNIHQHVMLGLKYVLESTADFSVWTAIGSPFTAQSEDIVTEVVVNDTVRYFRIRQVP